MHLFDVAVSIGDKLFARGEIDARISSEARLRLLLTVIQFVNLRPFGPWIVRLPRVVRTRQDFELSQSLTAVAHRCSHAVRSRISAPYDNHIFIPRRDIIPVLMFRIEQTFGVRVQKLHGKANTLELTARYGQVARFRCTAAEDHGIELLAQFRSMNIGADIGLGDEFDSLSRHQIYPPLHDALIKFHVWNSIHEQTPDSVCSFINGHQVAGAIELCRASEPRWARTNHGNLLARPLFRRLCRHPSLGKTIVNN